jgi:hypothetical protein
MEFKRHEENEKTAKNSGNVETHGENEKFPDADAYAANGKIEQQAENGEIIAVEVQAGELVGLTGEVRNDWLHRVVPEEETVHDRVSMVLGCRPQ